jgi:hypothetical protein
MINNRNLGDSLLQLVFNDELLAIGREGECVYVMSVGKYSFM